MMVGILSRLLLVIGVAMASAVVVLGFEIQLSSTSLVAKSDTPSRLTMRCSVENMKVDSVWSITMSRRTRGSSQWRNFAGISAIGANANTPHIDTTAPQDIRAKIQTMSGSLGNAPNAAQSDLEAVFTTKGLSCEFDEADYKCILLYTETKNAGVITLESDVKSLKIYYPPSTVTPFHISARDVVTGVGNPLYNNTRVPIGSTLQFTCSGDIGSDDSTKVVWYKKLSPGAPLTVYIPDNSESIHVQKPEKTGCTYQRITTASYTTASLDRYGVHFQCRVVYRPPVNNARSYTVESAVFRVIVDVSNPPRTAVLLSTTTEKSAQTQRNEETSRGAQSIPLSSAYFFIVLMLKFTLQLLDI